ncbi:hypothetical protein [Catenovulum agarivorans]|uniref:hypothetical protein n=1 Tax=Catenovulum agarivorans TaxID=1172192 RepID=UPI0002D61095|nr:hypothetical protein [Catenovulum agarivorans]
MKPIHTKYLARTGLLTLLLAGTHSTIAAPQLTQQPETEGSALFTNSNTPTQNIAGFEFCCGQYNTYQEHSFSNATSALLYLDGGHWKDNFAGVVGDRLFASFGLGYTSEGGSSSYFGYDATGSIDSPTFSINTNYINFKIGGGNNKYTSANATAAVLLINGQVVRHATGKNLDNTLAWHSWDVSDLQGQTASIRLIDNHSDNGIDSALPYLLADEFRAANLAAAMPTTSDYVQPELVGEPLFINASNPSQDIAGFEFCCAGYASFSQHNFDNVVSDLAKLDGGQWAANYSGAIGDRVFSSAGDGYQDINDTSLEPIGEQATGSLDSPEFVISKSYINFLLGGGNQLFDAANATAALLIINNQIVRQASGNNSTDLSWHSWDVEEFIGQTAQIRLLDYHVADNSDAATPYLLADQFRASDIPATQNIAGEIDYSAAPITSSPATEGQAAFSSSKFPTTHIAGFENCCFNYDTYHAFNFLAYGDFVRFSGGQWASGLANYVGDRVFASYGQGYANYADTTGSWYGWEATGRLLSPEFTITQPYINLLTAGGTNTFDTANATAIVLRVNGKVVRHATGNGSETELTWTSWDTSSLVGQQAVIEIIDQHDNSVSDGSLPFILVDEIRQADKAAVTPLTSSIVSQVDGHKVALQLNMGDANPYYENGEFYIYYLQNSAYHSWYLSKTDDLLTGTFSEEIIPASGDVNAQDRWIGSGSVMKDQSGQYHLFYTGHNKDHYPVEAVMHAVATDNTLKNWQTINEHTFTGSNGYSDYDFRDPFVFWHEDEQRYWMLLTSRYNNQAAIGLYTSTDLANWTAQPPLYAETSPLNLEVPEYFEFADTPFIVYSDQRNESPVVKYLVKQNNQWVKPNFDALDGRYFYAARSAGPENERLLFGWVPHTDGRNDGAAPSWGGDLLVHQLHKHLSGELAVKMPDKVISQLNSAMPISPTWTQGSVQLQTNSASLQANSAFALPASSQVNRLQFNISSASASAVTGIQFRMPVAGQADKLAYLKLDPTNGNAKFYFDGDEENSTNPSIDINLDMQSGVHVDLWLNPQSGVGAIYLNHYRALSFRLYDLAEYQIGLFSENSATTASGLTRYSE